MSSGRIVPPLDRAVAPALFEPKGIASSESAGIYDRDVKIFLILKVPSSCITSIVFIEFEFWPLLEAFLA